MWWATDGTYLPMAKGFAYLVAILTSTAARCSPFGCPTPLATDFCIEALEEALGRYGAPEIFNTDQGSQYTAEEFTAVLETKSVRISMDGKGRWIDNVFIERLWRSGKYEDIYLHAYQTPREVKVALARYFGFYNARRPHQSLEYRTPDVDVLRNEKPERGSVGMQYGFSTVRCVREKRRRHAAGKSASQLNI